MPQWRLIDRSVPPDNLRPFIISFDAVQLGDWSPPDAYFGGLQPFITKTPINVSDGRRIYPQALQQLPLWPKHNLLVDLLKEKQVLIFQAPTGAGKSILIHSVLIDVARASRAKYKVIHSMPTSQNVDSTGEYCDDLYRSYNAWPMIKVQHFHAAERPDEEARHYDVRAPQNAPVNVGYRLNYKPDEDKKNPGAALITTPHLAASIVARASTLFAAVWDEVHDCSTGAERFYLECIDKLKKGELKKLAICSATLLPEDVDRITDHLQRHGITYAVAPPMTDAVQPFNVDRACLTPSVNEDAFVRSIMTDVRRNESARLDIKAQQARSGRIVTDPQGAYDSWPDGRPIAAIELRRAEEIIDSYLFSCVPHYVPQSAVHALIFVRGIEDAQELKDHILSQAYCGNHHVEVFIVSSQNKQDLKSIMEPPTRARVLIATPLLETGVTIDGLHLVLDTGLRKVRAPHDRRNIVELETLRTDMQSVEQRKGRVGRTGVGISISTTTAARLTECAGTSHVRLKIEREHTPMTLLSYPCAPEDALMVLTEDQVAELLEEADNKGMLREPPIQPYLSNMQLPSTITAITADYFPFLNDPRLVELILDGVAMKTLFHSATLACLLTVKGHCLREPRENDDGYQPDDARHILNFWLSNRKTLRLLQSDMIGLSEVIGQRIIDKRASVFRHPPYFSDTMSSYHFHESNVEEVLRLLVLVERGLFQLQCLARASWKPTHAKKQNDFFPFQLFAPIFNAYVTKKVWRGNELDHRFFTGRPAVMYYLADEGSYRLHCSTIARLGDRVLVKDVSHTVDTYRNQHTATVQGYHPRRGSQSVALDNYAQWALPPHDGNRSRFTDLCARASGPSLPNKANITCVAPIAALHCQRNLAVYHSAYRNRQSPVARAPLSACNLRQFAFFGNTNHRALAVSQDVDGKWTVRIPTNTIGVVTVAFATEEDARLCTSYRQSMANLPELVLAGETVKMAEVVGAVSNLRVVLLDDTYASFDNYE